MQMFVHIELIVQLHSGCVSGSSIYIYRIGGGAGIS